MTRTTMALALCAASAAARAEKLAVLPVSGVNVDPSYLDAAQDLLRAHMQKTGRWEIVVVRGAPSRDEPLPSQAAEQARAVGASLAAVAHLTRLGMKARVTLTIYRAGDAGMAYFDEMAAASPDDLDVVLERMARGYATGRPARQTGDIESVTEKESQALAKVEATHVFGLRVSGLVPVNGGDGAPEALPGFSIFWLYDARDFLAGVTIGFHTQDDAGTFAVGVEAFYPFLRTNFSPYVGGGAEWGTFDAGAGSEGESGITVYGAGGILLGRLSTVQARAEVGYFVNTFSVATAADFDSTTGEYEIEERRLHGLMFSAGIGF